MLRANVYCVEALPPDREKAIYDGLDLVAQHIGEMVSPKTLRVRLPRTATGKVNPRQVGYNRLPRLIDLHVFAVPLEPTKSKRLGLGFLSLGLSYIDSSQGMGVTRSVAAHEAAHSLGFVLNYSAQLDSQSRAHCCDGGCIMHKTLFHADGQVALSGKGSNAVALSQTRLTTREMLELPQDDFCGPCQTDMNSFGGYNLAVLRIARQMTGRIIPEVTTVVDLPQ